MAITKSRTVSEARQHMRDVVDEAVDGRSPIIQRHGQRVVVVGSQRLVEMLAHVLPQVLAVAEDGGWSLMLPGYPLAADAVELDDAVTEFGEAVQQYGVDWFDRLRHSPNHAPNWPLAQFAVLAGDADIRNWVLRVPE